MVLFSLSSQDLADPLSFLGSTINDLFSNPTPPDEVYPSRGTVENEDNVVFYYSDGFYLFLYANRVWQVRYDKNYPAAVFELNQGMDKGEIVELKGTPFIENEDNLVYEIDEKSYPLRMKLFFVEDKLDDIYFYRADY